MLTIKEITELRKNGDLSRAYKECSVILKSNPEDKFARISMAYCLKGMMELASDQMDVPELCRLIREYAELHLEAVEEHEMNNKISWVVRGFVMKYAEDERLNTAMIDRIFDAVMSVDFLTPHRYYSVLLDAFLKVKEIHGNVWQGLAQMVEWWGLENLLEEDFKKVLLANGHWMISLAERVLSAYVKVLLIKIAKGEHVQEAVAFADNLAQFVIDHPDIKNLNYYRAKIYKALGMMGEARTAAREFVKQRPKEFWSWSMLAELIDDDKAKLSCYCKALTCPSDPSFLVKVKAAAGVLMYYFGNYPEARREFDDIIAIHTKKGWNIPQNVEEITHQQWYQSTVAAANNAPFYRAHCDLAEDFFYGDIPEVGVLISHINHQKQVCGFVTEDRRNGYFSIKKSKETFVENQIYSVRFNGDIPVGKPASFCTIKRVVDFTPYAGKLFRKETLEVTLRLGQQFTFVGDVYIDAKMLPIDFRSGDIFEVISVPYYNIKRDQWSWRAVQLKRPE